MAEKDEKKEAKKSSNNEEKKTEQKNDSKKNNSNKPHKKNNGNNKNAARKVNEPKTAVKADAEKAPKAEKKEEKKPEEVKGTVTVSEDVDKAYEKVKAKEDKKAEKADKKAEKKARKEEKKAKGSDGKVAAKVKMIITVIVILVLLGLIAYVVNSQVKKKGYQSKNPIATIDVENFGKITVELYPDMALNTVTNFIALANHGFYNGLTFHRTIPDFMIQGGDPNGDGTGNAKLTNLGLSEDKKYSIKGEFILNGFTQNTLKHKRGVISMARSDYSNQQTGANTASMTKKGYDSGSSQFFIMTSDRESLDGAYAAFGKVINGMDVVDKIANVEVQTRDGNSTDANVVADKPKNPPKIKSITVDTKGVDYGLPQTQEPFDYYSYMMKQYYGSSAIGGGSTDSTTVDTSVAN